MISKIAEKILKERYLQEGETFKDMCKRVAKAVGSRTLSRKIADMMEAKIFMPSSPFLVNAGGNNNFFSCFVVPVDDSIDGICKALHDEALIQKSYGGVGFSFSSIRPKGAKISSNEKGGAAGPVAFMHVFAAMAEAIKQGGSRSGALMAVLRVDHPDIAEFITCKQKDGELANFNISVAVTDEFMKKVQDDGYYTLKHEAVKTTRVVNARRIWEMIIQNAHTNGEPGVLFIDRINRDNPNPDLGKIEATNPCVTAGAHILTGDGFQFMHELINNPRKFLNVIPDERTVRRKEDFYRSTAPFRTSFSKPTYMVRTRRGYSLEVTENHEFFVYDPGSNTVFKQELKNMNIGDEVLLYNSEGKRKGFARNGNHEAEGLLYGIVASSPEKHFVDDCFGDGPKLLFDMRTGSNAFMSDEKRKKFYNKALKAIAKLDSDLSETVPGYCRCAKLHRYIEHYHKSDRYIIPTGLSKFFFGPETYGSEYVSTLENEEFYHGVVGTHRYPLITRILSCSFGFFKSFMQTFEYLKGGKRIERRGLRKIVFENHDLSLLRAVQMRLLSVGVVTTLKPGKTSHKRVGNFVIKWGQREPSSLTIEEDFIPTYVKMIGLYDDMYTYWTKKAKAPTRHMYMDVVESITQTINSKPTYCVTQKNGNAVVFNGLATGNCGESPLLPYESCCLGSLNLGKIAELALEEYARNNYLNFMDEGYIVRDKRKNDVIQIFLDKIDSYGVEALRFLNASLYKNAYPIPEIEQQTMMTKKLGLGVMGFADACILLNIRYGSCACLALIDKIGKVFEGIKSEDEFADNSTLFSIAPTGTISMLAGCSSGIEPIFRFEYKRKILDGREEITEYHPLYAKYHPSRMEKKYFGGNGLGNGQLCSPECWVEAHEIKPLDHVRVQAQWQKYIDLAVSKTINLHQSATVKQVDEAITMAWELGCKGVTVYRDGSREGQVLSEAIEKKPTVVLDNIDRLEKATNLVGEIMEFTPEETAEWSVPAVPTLNNELWTHLKEERPETLPGTTWKIRTTEGKFYLTINSYKGHPFEVFSTPHSDSKEGAVNAECVCRIVSLALRSGVDPKEIIGQCEKVRHQSMLSLPHHIATKLKEVSEKVETKPMKQVKITALCPECGSDVVYRDGCKNCISCGWSKCE